MHNNYMDQLPCVDIESTFYIMYFESLGIWPTLI